MKKLSDLVILTLIVIVTLSIPSTVFPRTEVNEEGDLVEVADGGTINWTTKRIEATGCAERDQSLYQQKMVAEVSARSNLLRILDGVHITAERIVRDGRLRGEISTEKIEGFLKHSRVSEPRTNSLGLMEVSAYISLNKEGLSVLLPPGHFKNGVDRLRASESSVNLDSAGSENLYTGLIIDTTGLAVRPSIMPRILSDKDERDVLKPEASDRKYIIQQGFCGYAASLDKAKSLTDRVGNRPLVVKAVKVGPNGVDLFVNEEDANKIQSENMQGGIFSKGRIIIVAGGSSK
jgi:hypothetical protein